MPQSEHSAAGGEAEPRARPRRLGLSGRRGLLKGLDAAAAAAAWWLFLRPALAGAASSVATAGRVSALAVVASLLVLLFLWVVAVEGAGGYPPEAGRGRKGAPGGVRVLLPGPALVAGALVLLLHAAGAGLGLLALPGWGGALGFLAALALLPAVPRLALRPLLARPEHRPRVLVVGLGEGVARLAASVREEGGSTYDVVGFVRAAGDGADPGGAVPVVGESGDLARLVEERGGDVVALADPRRVGGPLREPLARLVERGVEVVPLADLVERVAGRVPLDPPEAAAASLPLAPPATDAAHRAAKRALDLALVAVGLVFFLPVVPLIALAIRLETPGPVFYTQERVGRGGEVFEMVKFRSMVADAEAEGAPRWATEGDPRITRVGRLLRGMHLDEFPQMLNILRGEMSPVGPRPERPEFVERLEGEIPHYRMRHAVRPGMAGWALVEHGYASSLEEAREKHEYDLYYVKHQSVWLDLVVLARTLVDSFSLGGR